MADSPIAINLDLTKPATVLIEKIASAANILYEPQRIKRKATADAEAKLILAEGDIRVAAVQRRAVNRMIAEETRKQQNMEGIIAKALPQLESTAQPEHIDDDWIANFFEKSRLTSDEEMQVIWSRILAGEANKPGAYSRRTVNTVAELDRKDAEAFASLINFAWNLSGKLPLIFNTKDEIYRSNGIYFDVLNHLEVIGLVTFSGIMGYQKTAQGTGGVFQAEYLGQFYALKVPQENTNVVKTGQVLLTAQGQQLVGICSSKPVQGFEEYVVKKFEEQGLTVTKLNKAKDAA